VKYLVILILIIIPLKYLSAQTSADAYYDVLDDQYRKNGSKNNNAFFIDEFKEFMLLYPNSKQEDEALFNIARLYKAGKNVPEQLFTLIKLRILHPKSPLNKKAYRLIDSLIVYNNELLLTDANEKAIKDINNMNPAVSHQAAYLEFLSFLHFAGIKIFERLLIDETRNYKILYGKNSSNLDVINYWQACAFNRLGDYNAALLYFQKVTDIFHSSKFVASSLLQMSEIYTKTNRQNKAVDCLIELINQYPDAQETGDAQYQLAQLYHYYFKDMNEALTNYKMLAQVFPENQNFNLALMNAAKISESMGDYQDALGSYMMIVENNKITEQTQEALKNILNIHLNILKEYSLAAQDYILLTQMFPGSKDAAQNLLKAARLYKENVKDPRKTNEILQIILKNYKDSAAAKEAEKILNEK
jgi:TolA-binding protein